MSERDEHGTSGDEPTASAAEPAELAPEPADADTGRLPEQEQQRSDPAPEPAPTASEETEPAPESTGSEPSEQPPARKRRSLAGAVIGLLVGLLGFALVVQVRSNATDPTLASAREADLVQILADLESRSQRLQSDITDLTELKRQLTSDAQGSQAALEQARMRADQLGILSGTLPAQGPGLTFTFEAKTEQIRAVDILDAVQELRNAGAEAMQIDGADGRAVRIIHSTYFIEAGKGALEVDGQTLTGPFVITVIGDPDTMDKALRIPGGPVTLVTSHGGNVIVGEPGTVTVTALRASPVLRYAEPVS